MIYRGLGGLVIAYLAGLGTLFATQQSEVTLTIVSTYTGALITTGDILTEIMVDDRGWTASTGTTLVLVTNPNTVYELIDLELNSVIVSGTTIGSDTLLADIERPASGTYEYAVRMIRDGVVAMTNTLTFSVDHDAPIHTGPVIVESVTNTSTNQESVRFRRPEAYDVHTAVAYYTMTIYNEHSDMLYNIQLSQRELYIDYGSFSAGDYVVSMTATDVLGNESSPVYSYYTIAKQSTTTGYSGSGPSDSSTDSEEDEDQEYAHDEPIISDEQDAVGEESTTDDRESDMDNTTDDITTVDESENNTNQDGRESGGMHETNSVKQSTEDNTPSQQNNNSPTTTQSIDLRDTEESTPIFIESDQTYYYHAAAPESETTTLISTAHKTPTPLCRKGRIIILCQIAVIGYLRRLLFAGSLLTKNSTKNLTERK